MRNLTLPALLAVSCLVPGGVEAADEVFDSKGVKIRYVTEGEGEPVVLIHGWMTDSSMWGRDASGNTQLKPPDGYRLIALDCRGHGKSDKPYDPEMYGPEMAADVVRLLDHLKIEKAHLIGYSSGAFIAANVAATRPERVLSVVYAGQAPLVAELETSKSSPEVEAFAKAVDEGKVQGANGRDVKALAVAGRSFTKLEVSGEQLKKCEAPILFIHGGNEADSVKNRVAAVRQLLGRGEVKVIEGGNHITTLLNPEFAAAIVEFLHSTKPR